jgi:hypothetical protein
METDAMSIGARRSPIDEDRRHHAATALGGDVSVR